jgi:predicted nucleic acid-binding protein
VKRVFVDTSAFFAHLVVEDAHHLEARALFERAARESCQAHDSDTGMVED